MINSAVMHGIDSASLRHPCLSGLRRVLVKVGSAVLADNRGILNLDVVDRLAGELAGLHDQGLDVVLVSSGAVAAGRGRVAETVDGAVLYDLPGRQAASAVGQGRLVHHYDEALARRGKLAAQILLTRDGLSLRSRFLNARNTLERLLEWRAIPIINENDTVSVKELEFGDNDTLASLTLGLIGADLFVNLTSAGGVFDKNPDLHPDARLLPLIESIRDLDLESICAGKTSVGTGGMYSKLLAACRAAQLGVPTLILSGRDDFSIFKALADPGRGTLVLPEGKTVSRKKFWLAYHDDPAGDLWIDAGAARALTERGKSLLPAGIRKVEGEFEQGSLVRLRDADGATLGVGLANYDSNDLARIMGRKTSEIEALLGHAPYSSAVHRDNLLLDAAVKEPGRDPGA